MAVQRIVLADVASRIRTLLDTATITRPGEEPARVRPTDIAVLVPSQRRAAEAAAVFRDWAIPSVRARTGSVLNSEATVQWRLLLAGLVSPTRAGVARAAGLGWFFDLRPGELADGFTGDGFESTAGPFATAPGQARRSRPVGGRRRVLRGVAGRVGRARDGAVARRMATATSPTSITSPTC